MTEPEPEPEHDGTVNFWVIFGGIAVVAVMLFKALSGIVPVEWWPF